MTTESDERDPTVPSRSPSTAFEVWLRANCERIEPKDSADSVFVGDSGGFGLDMLGYSPLRRDDSRITSQKAIQRGLINRDARAHDHPRFRANRSASKDTIMNEWCTEDKSLRLP